MKVQSSLSSRAGSRVGRSRDGLRRSGVKRLARAWAAVCASTADCTTPRGSSCVPGIALRVLSGDRVKFDAVMVDEFHERGWETDLLVARLSREETPLVITSATLDQERVASTLGAASVEAEGRRYPLTIRHAESPAEPSPEGLEQRVASALRAAWPPPDGGDALVFLPGKGEIRRAAAAVGQIGEVIEVHGGVRPDVLAKHFAAPSGGRIFLATNVAETSLTIPGVTLVLDGGLVRRRLHRGGRSVSRWTAPRSQRWTSARPRGAGRAGRVVRLWSARFRPREALLRRSPASSWTTSPAAGRSARRSKRPTPCWWIPRRPSRGRPRPRARALGTLDEAGRITPRGREWTTLPVGPAEARLLAGAPPALAGALADVVALLELRRPLWLSIEARSDAAQAEVRAARARLLGDLDDEVRAAMRLLRRGDARAHALDGVALAEARRTADRLRAAVGAPRLTDAADVPTRRELVRVILSRWPEVGYVARERALSARKKRGVSDREPWANAEGELQVRLPSMPWLEDPPAPPVAGVVLDTAWLGVGATQVRGVGGFIILPGELTSLTRSSATARSGRRRSSGASGASSRRWSVGSLAWSSVKTLRR